MDLEQMAQAVRGFNRFYTNQIGVLGAKMLHTRFSLAEARILFELGQRKETTASVLQAELQLDAGYLSRIVRDLAADGFVAKITSQADRRQRILRLTEKGRDAYATLDTRSQAEVEAILQHLSGENRHRLVKAMAAIQDVLVECPSRPPYVLRPHEPGDIGWVTHRHGVLYSEEYGWDESFEALVAGILSEFINNYNPKWERSWIAELDGQVVGSVFISRENDAVAKLRLLLVEPKARGKGLGKRLVEECIRFSRRVGYRKIMLWTNSVLLAARHIYEQGGFHVVSEEPHHSFGHDLVGETWELDL